MAAPFLPEHSSTDYSAVRYLAEKALRREPDFKGLKYDYIGKAGRPKKNGQPEDDGALATLKKPHLSPRNTPYESLGQTVDITRMEAILQQQNKRQRRYLSDCRRQRLGAIDSRNEAE